MKLKCVIIDDEPIARQLIAGVINNIDYPELLCEAENLAKALWPLMDTGPCYAMQKTPATDVVVVVVGLN